ncbi:MAG: hypothetical protein JWM77_1542 [Rhodospirillales bacterium]|nr:hypothetical protein [Rhodospirillales bacterium]
MRTLYTMLAASLLSFATVPASAVPITFQATLRGAEEVPPTSSTATGFATFVADTVAETVSVDLSVSGLTTPSVAGHLHFAPPGVAGPIILPFTGLPNTTAFTYSHSFTAADLTNSVTTGIATFGALLSAIEAGNTYANVHTTNFPGGEIRGQLEAARVAEPASVTLLAVGAGLLLLLLRRRATS